MKLNEKITCNLPDSITDTGIAAINEHLVGLGYPTLPDTFDLSWLVTRGEYAGTFPKRVSSWLKREHGKKIDSLSLSKIGNLAKMHGNDGSQIIYDVTDRLDWNAGDFGDSGSCFWGSYAQTRYHFQQSGFLAMRLYDENGNGTSRSWVAPNLPEDGCYIMFNGYGRQLVVQARVLATDLGLSYKKIRLSNFGEYTSEFYINSGVGYLLGLPEQIEDVEEYDFEMRVGVCECDWCGTYLRPTFLYDVDGDQVCSNCVYHSEGYALCQVCYTVVDSDQGIDTDYGFLCNNCHRVELPNE